jgi:peptide/nickel transport system substrate-binding protein
MISILIIFIFNFSAAAVELKDPWISEKEQGEHGGTLITTLLGDPKTFNTIIAKETSSSAITDGYIFEGMVTRNGVSTEYEAELAKDWEISEDGRKYTFYLREGVQWSDGEEFTADDVIFTFDLISDESIPTSSRDVMKVDGQFPEYNKIDKYTVEFILPTSFAPFLNNMTAPILPRHKLYSIWQEGDFNNSWGINTEPSEIVGTGPFKLADYKNGERVVMEKNQYYWRKDPAGESLPYFERWIRIIAESQETDSLLFENGQTHYLSVRGIDYRRMKEQEENSDFKLIDAGPTFSTNFLVFNLNPRNPNLEEEPYKYQWFTNLNFRRAVAYSFDKDTMINQALAGQGSKQWSAVSLPNKVFLNENVKKYPYDLEKARDELKKGGFEWNENGELFDENGNRVKFNMVTNAGNNVRESLLNIIASELRELGMEVNTNPIEFNKMVSQLSDEWNFDTILIGLTGGVEPHQGSNVWMSNGHLHMWNPVQEEPATDWEKRIDELFVKGASTVETEKRKEYYDEFQEIIAEQIPLIYTVTPNSIYAVRDSLKNTEITAYGGVLWNIHELYLEN